MPLRSKADVLHISPHITSRLALYSRHRRYELFQTIALNRHIIEDDYDSEFGSGQAHTCTSKTDTR